MQNVILPSQLDVVPLLNAVGQTFNLTSPPSRISFDFQPIKFALPSGIVLLHNLTRYLLRQNCEVYYTDTNRDCPALRFMDDIGFFEDHLGRSIWPTSSLRQTTCRLIEVQHSESHAWIAQQFVPWFARCSGRPEGALADLRTCISEIFNNIQDHAGLHAGSIFAQWYPRREELAFSIADFGRGIPSNVNRVLPQLTPSEAIVKAFEAGFSTKGHPNNQGAGLDFLRQIISTNLEGSIKVYSGGGAATCNSSGEISTYDVQLGNSGYTGTLIDIVLPTKFIDEYEPEAEDGIW